MQYNNKTGSSNQSKMFSKERKTGFLIRGKENYGKTFVIEKEKERKKSEKQGRNHVSNGMLLKSFAEFTIE